MGAKAKKALKKNLSKASTCLSVTRRKSESSDFLPLEGDPGRKVSGQEEPEQDTATVLYIGHIPHGFYEEQMEGFFKQFGNIKKLRIARNKKETPSNMGLLNLKILRWPRLWLMKSIITFLQIHLIPPEHVHPLLWKGVNKRYKPLNWVDIARKQHNKEKTAEEHRRMIQGILKRDEKRHKRIKAAGIDYECPDFVGHIQLVAKKIKFVEEQD